MGSVNSDWLRTVVEQAAESIIITDLEGKILYVNSYFEKTMGYKAQEIIGRPFNILRSAYHDDNFYIDIWRTISKGKIWRGVISNQRKDGSLIKEDVTLFPLFDPQGAMIGYAHFKRNISETQEYSHRLEKQLNESQLLLEVSQLLAGSLELKVTLQQIADGAATLIKSSSRIILHLLDDSGTYLHAVAVSGKDRPSSDYSMNFRPGEGIAGIVLATGQTINVKDIFDDPRYIVAKKKTSYLLRSLLVAPVSTQDKKLGTISVQSPIPNAFTDDDERLLTTLGALSALAIEKARLLEELKNSLEHEKATRAHLVQSEKLAALGRIIASVAHELNNPMQAIQNALYLIMIEEDQLSSQAREDLQIVLNETERMAGLIARLRETYRPTTGEEFQPGSLNNLVNDVLKLLSTHLRRNKITLELFPDPDLPNVSMIWDQMKQVLLNICINAVEVMPDGGKLSLRTWDDVENGWAWISISDTGPGINEQTLPNIFMPFVTDKEGGTGLGLAITYDIIQRHHGKIDVKSALGQGTTFLIALPRVSSQ